MNVSLHKIPIGNGNTEWQLKVGGTVVARTYFLGEGSEAEALARLVRKLAYA